MKKKLCCCQPSRVPLNLNSLLDAKQQDEIAEVAKMEYDDWSPVVKQNWERYMAWTKEEEEEESKYLSEFPHAVKTNIADNHTLPFPKLLPNEGLKVESFEEDSFATTNLFSKNKGMESKLVTSDPLLAEERLVTSDPLLLAEKRLVMTDPFLAEKVAKMEIINLFPAKKQEEETKFISEEKPPPVTTKVAKMEYDDWSPVVKQNWERYLARKKEKEEERKYLSEFPPAVKTNIADNHTLPFPKLLPNEEVEVAKMEYTNWSPFLKENCERYLARKKEEDRKYLSDILSPAVKTNIADNHTLTTTKPFPNLFPNEGLKVESFEGDPFAEERPVTSGTLFVMSDPFLAERVAKRLEEEPLETTNPVCNPFPAKKEKESKFVMTKPLVAEKRPVTSDPLLAEKRLVMSDPFLAERTGVAKRRKVESLEEEPLETTNPVCNPFPAKKEKESKFVIMTKPLVAEMHPVMSDPFLAERPPHMFLNIFFAYQQKVEKLAEMLKIESIEGEPQVTTDPLVSKKHHVSAMLLNLFLAYKQEVERVAKMLKKESIDGEPFVTTYPILAEKPPVLAYQQESSKKKEEESNTTNIDEKHTLTYFDDKLVSQPACSSDTAK